jgi:hypothetical protein
MEGIIAGLGDLYKSSIFFPLVLVAMQREDIDAETRVPYGGLLKGALPTA